MTRRRLTLSGIIIAAVAAWYLSVQPSARAGALPEQLSGKAFWQLSAGMSEPDGSFRSHNLLSNEIWMQHVIPELVEIAKPGRVYMGVGPEQNFTYIAAIKPAMVFIVDVRRGNLHLHMMYKALFELSKDRAEFVGRLFAKKRPSGLTAQSSVADIFNAYAEVPASEAVFNQNIAAMREHFATTRAIPLSEADLDGIRWVAQQFFLYGPGISYSAAGGRFGRSMPTYTELMMSTDAAGQNRAFLSTEDKFLFLKGLHEKNLFVPVVGNFGGDKAVRAVGEYVRNAGSTVAAFYLSNVEQYLGQQGIWDAFCANVATLPLDADSRFIRSVRGSPGGFGNSFRNGFGYPGLVNLLGKMQDETSTCR